MQLLVATGNAGKLREIRKLFAEHPCQVLGLEDLPPVPEAVEDGASFAENAEKKARHYAQLTGLPTLADDSGLVVDALDGAPGIYSARYAGEKAGDAANNRKLLEALQGVPAVRRRAAFVCALALCEPDGTCRQFAGRLEGVILMEPRGDEGFGYDPLFLVPEYGKTLAELPLAIKNRISHRGQALKQLLLQL